MNMINYASIYLKKKQSAEYEYCQAFEMKRFAKVKVEVCVLVWS